MIKPSTVATLAWGLLACPTSMAVGDPAICIEPALPGLHVVEIQCDVAHGRVVFSFSGPEPTSPYASDFDRRRVAIAKATSTRRLKLPGGPGAESHSPRSAGFQLLSPPAQEQIVQREEVKKAVKKSGWHIVTERVSYGAQGGRFGFVMECSTATHWHKTYALAVAECYPLEERQRFVKTLELIP